MMLEVVLSDVHTVESYLSECNRTTHLLKKFVRYLRVCKGGAETILCW